METITSSMGKLSAHTSSQVERIWNATQHLATQEQLEHGVTDLPEELRKQLTEHLTFENIPTSEELRMRSIAVVGMLMTCGVKCGDKVMLGGAPFFMEELSHSCREVGFVPVFAFSKRESAEQAMPDGTVRKVAIFRHLGFVEPTTPQP